MAGVCGLQPAGIFDPASFSVALGTFLSDTEIGRGGEFVRRIQALGRDRGVEVQWIAHRGKGSHGLLYYGSDMTTVRN
jgi:hypothetical protein